MAKKCAVGGQAVIEGVLMKSDDKVAIAVRKPNKKISVKKKRYRPVSKRFKFLGWPFFRGVVNLIEMLVIGIKALNYSANESLGEKEEKISGWSMILTTIVALIIALALFKLLPLALTRHLFNYQIVTNTVLFNLIDGIIRISIFILYIVAISFMADVKKLFQYHGAEHKTVNCYEAGKAITVKNIKRFSTLHPRCGTSFLFIVLIIAILIFSVVKIDISFWLLFVYRLPLLLPIAAIAYEVLKITDKYKKNAIMKIVIVPGLFVQKLTTREPDKRQIEVAIKAFKAVVKT